MNEPSSWPANPFWDFSLALYRRPGVAQACLDVQARHGLDVNLILYFAWLGIARGIHLSDADIATVLARVAAWHDGVVRSLRAVRSEMKGNPTGAPADLAEALRNRIKGAELDAERIEQLMLFQLDWSNAQDARPGPHVARENIYTYLKNRGIVRDSATTAAIEAIVGAAEP